VGHRLRRQLAAHLEFDGLFVKQTYADAAVDGSRLARRRLVMGPSPRSSVHDVTPRYRSTTILPHRRTRGFPLPVDLAIPVRRSWCSTRTDRRLWAAFELNTDIHVIWSVSPDHWSWNTTGVLENRVDSDDIATVVPRGNSIGVLWSDQSSDAGQFGFRTAMPMRPRSAAAC
jgi:hypothetical protein